MAVAKAEAKDRPKQKDLAENTENLDKIEVQIELNEDQKPKIRRKQTKTQV
jgi:hypothetical protein